MIQPDLFETSPYLRHPKARRSDPISSHLAGTENERSGRAATQRDQVLRALRNQPNSTTKELAEMSGLDRHMVARRMPELEQRGLARGLRLPGGIQWWVV